MTIFSVPEGSYRRWQAYIRQAARAAMRG
jgi:hypothetical protein